MAERGWKKLGEKKRASPSRGSPLDSCPLVLVVFLPENEIQKVSMRPMNEFSISVTTPITLQFHK